ncbi:MAG: PRC-barrel domain-containing protein [Plectolyngbya sp. WJT66-NPBG17]|jgi:sporulation protein YlmC with PRC-barrel domain|nr:PRC-barrel domain-containing protein [Plectolyngbya sp. WJT66-NPBG17]MBW4528016.1 PRC-barrel domain-containing protein [Phormidium tanganyikae FI6-MK23]
MTEEFRQRSDILGTQVITRSTGKRLGVVSQLWVDIDSQEVVALSLRPNLFYGTAQPMMLASIRQIGDVILVDDEDVIEDVDLEGYSNLVGYEVITETGELLGKVRGFRFNIDTGKLDNLVIASIGLPLIPDQIVSTYELPITEIVSSGPDRLIVIEGSEDRMSQLSVGVLERLGIGKAPWEREQDQYLAPARPENQLPSGQPTRLETPQQRQPLERIEETWEPDEWEDDREPIPLQREPEPPRQKYREAEIYPTPEAYEEDEEDNWGGLATRDDEYEDDNGNYVDDDEEEPISVEYEIVQSEPSALPESFEPGNLDEDPWADTTKDEEEILDEAEETEDPGVPLPPLNIPDKPKQKQPEYEEEGY